MADFLLSLNWYSALSWERAPECEFKSEFHGPANRKGRSSKDSCVLFVGFKFISPEIKHLKYSTFEWNRLNMTSKICKNFFSILMVLFIVWLYVYLRREFIKVIIEETRLIAGFEISMWTDVSPAASSNFGLMKDWKTWRGNDYKGNGL